MTNDTKKTPLFGDDATVPTTVQVGSEAGSAGVRLLVFGAEEPVSFPITEAGTYTIGRSLEADIYVKDPSLSRLHAALTFEPQNARAPFRIRDLGSSNGTRLKGKAMPPEVDLHFQPGDQIELGNCTILIQQGATIQRPRRVWPHSYLELRMEDLCSRARARGDAFAILRVRVKSPVPTVPIEKALTSLLGPEDVIAAYAPLQYDVLLSRGGPIEAEEAASAVRFGLRRLGAESEIAMACFPRDGRAPGMLISRLAQGEKVRPRTPSTSERDAVIIEDAAMRRLHDLAAKVAESDISVLILGETGVGKEIMAKVVHARSKRAGKPFLALNCGAFTQELLESELFGHERGAFTGAIARKPGLLETVQGGTIFLDEVGELALETQVKLLRVLEERRLRRVGGLEPIAFDARFLAATNRDLEQAIREGSFREDLYYRLNGFALLIPPLRERKREIPTLAETFAQDALRREGSHAEPHISDRAMEALTEYAWPGNVRELKNVMERAVVLADGASIDLQHLPMEKLTSPVIFGASRPSVHAPPPPIPQADRTPVGPPPLPSAKVLRAKVASVERDEIIAALEKVGGNQSRAAELLGMSRKSLLRRLDAYDIPRPRKGREEDDE
jgi:two-component system, NtrC family, response regulator AtoC